MTYLSRATHFFVKIIVVITLAFGAMYLLGWLDVESGQLVNTLFNTPKGWIVMVAVVAISVMYPSLSFSKAAIRGNFAEEMEIMHKVLTLTGYKLVRQDADRSEYRAASLWKRLLNQFDDRITVGHEGSYITVSGLKKEVLRIEGLFTQYRLNEE